MPWYVFAIITALVTSVNSVYEKRVLQRVPSLELSCAIAVGTFVLVLPLGFFVSWNGITPSAFLLIFFASFFGALAYLLAIKSLRHLDISTFEPLMSVGPAVTSFAAFLILGEVLSRQQTIGVLLAIVGSYILQSHPHERMLDPLKSFFRSRYFGYIGLVLLIHALTSLVDRSAVTTLAVSPLTYVFLIHVLLLFHFALLSVVVQGNLRAFQKGLQHMRWHLLPIAVMTIVARGAYAVAAQGAFIGMVASIKASSSFLSTLIGGELFHEKNLLRKAIASIIMITGSVVIILS